MTTQAKTTKTKEEESIQIELTGEAETVAKTPKAKTPRTPRTPKTPKATKAKTPKTVKAESPVVSASTVVEIPVTPTIVEIPVEALEAPIVETTVVEAKESPTEEYYPLETQSMSTEVSLEIYSPRCSIVRTKNSELLYYVAFPNEATAQLFCDAIKRKHNYVGNIHNSNKENSEQFPFEVSLLGINEQIFFDLVRRDLDRQPK